MKQVSIQQIVTLPIAKGATTPNPNGPAIVWSTVAGGLLLWDGNKWDSIVDDPELRSLAELNSFGFLVREPGTGLIVTRTIAGVADQTQITDGNGTSNPAIGLTDTGVIPGNYPKVTVDAQGRVRAGLPLTVDDMPTDFIRLYDENYTDAPLPTASGANSIALGAGSTAAAEKSFAIGEQAVARHKGGFVRAAGRFNLQGDAQVGQYILKAVTTNNFQREMFLDGPAGTSALILPDESTWTFDATVTAHRTDGLDGHAGFKIRGVIYRGTGATSVAFQGVPIVEIISRSNPTWNINTIANSVNGSLSFQVQGESSKTIRWVASVQTVEITN